MATETGDLYVLNAQKWLNNTYGNDSRFNVIPENGKTGWTTIYALTRALQIELGITSTADNFGPSTISKFNTKYPTGVHQQNDADESENNIYAIIQSALFCKGYSTGVNTPTLHFYNGTGSAIKKLKSDAGLSDTSSTVTLNVMKALLSMDYFYSYDTSTKTKNIQKIQRYLNGNYESYIGITPCDGVYGRGTNKALIYAIQAEEGMSTSVANGNFGPSTKNCCPTIPYNNVEANYNGIKYSTTQIERFAKLVNMGLYVNGVGDGNFNVTINSALIKQFQSRYALPVTGICNLTTWLSIFISSGDTSRSAKACDCATILTAEKAKTLYNNGYRYVGRYLSGTIVGGASKALSKAELQIAFNAGLRIFPIQQGNASYISYFTEEQAITDVNSAYQYATSLGIPRDTVIYFAVDCDPQDTDISNNIIPYFRKVSSIMNGEKKGLYKVGIYGTRNVCSKVSNKGYAVRSFVSDMSTGFSGNLGFTIPNNWAFDQFSTITVGSGAGSIEIDKDGYSGLDNGIGNIVNEEELNPDVDPDPDYNIPIGLDTKKPQPGVYVNRTSHPFNVYSSKAEGAARANPAIQEINEITNEFGFTLNSPSSSNEYGVAGRIVGEIKPGDLFVRFECRDNAYDNIPEFTDQVMNFGDSVHKVLFRNSDGVVRFGYIQEVITPDEYNIKDSIRYGREAFYYSNFDPEQNKLVDASLDISQNVYIVKRELRYRNLSGEEIGVLTIGTKLKGAGMAGYTYNDHIFFSYKYNEKSNEWEFLDSTNEKGGYVELDMKNGVNGYDRALW